jgi:hypothetical protein
MQSAMQAADQDLRDPRGLGLPARSDQFPGLPVLCGKCPNRKVVTRVGIDDKGIVWVAYSSPHPRWRIHARLGGGGTVPATAGHDEVWGQRSYGVAPAGSFVPERIAWAPFERAYEGPTAPVTITLAGCRRHPRAVRLDRLRQAIAEVERDGRSELVTFVDL